MRSQILQTLSGVFVLLDASFAGHCAPFHRKYVNSGDRSSPPGKPVTTPPTSHVEDVRYSARCHVTGKSRDVTMCAALSVARTELPTGVRTRKSAFRTAITSDFCAYLCSIRGCAISVNSFTVAVSCFRYFSLGTNRKSYIIAISRAALCRVQ